MDAGAGPGGTTARGELRIDAALHASRDLRVRLQDVHGTPGAHVWVTGAPHAGDGFAGVVARADGTGLVHLRGLPALARTELLVWPRYSSVPFPFVCDLRAPPDDVHAVAVDIDWTTPRRSLRLALVESPSGRVPRRARLGDLTLSAFDAAGNRLLTTSWTSAAAPDWSRIAARRVTARADGGFALEELDPPSPWWWCGAGPLFLDGSQDLLALPLPTGSVRLRVESPRFHTLDQWVDVPAEPEAARVRLALTPRSE